jgi:hypothetical protein
MGATSSSPSLSSANQFFLDDVYTPTAVTDEGDDSTESNNQHKTSAALRLKVQARQNYLASIPIIPRENLFCNNSEYEFLTDFAVQGSTSADTIDLPAIKGQRETAMLVDQINYTISLWLLDRDILVISRRGHPSILLTSGSVVEGLKIWESIKNLLVDFDSHALENVEVEISNRRVTIRNFAQNKIQVLDMSGDQAFVEETTRCCSDLIVNALMSLQLTRTSVGEYQIIVKESKDGIGNEEASGKMPIYWTLIEPDVSNGRLAYGLLYFTAVLEGTWENLKKTISYEVLLQSNESLEKLPITDQNLLLVKENKASIILIELQNAKKIQKIHQKAFFIRDEHDDDTLFDYSSSLQECNKEVFIRNLDLFYLHEDAMQGKWVGVISREGDDPVQSARFYPAVRKNKVSE